MCFPPGSIALVLFEEFPWAWQAMEKKETLQNFTVHRHSENFLGLLHWPVAQVKLYVHFKAIPSPVHSNPATLHPLHTGRTQANKYQGGRREQIIIELPKAHRQLAYYQHIFIP